MAASLDRVAPRMGKAGLWILTAITTAIGLITAFYCLLITSWTVSGPMDGGVSFDVAVVLPEGAGAPHELIDTQFTTDRITVTPGEAGLRILHPVTASRVLLGIATALPFTVVMAGCLGVLVLTAKLAKQRPFTGPLQWTLGGLSLLTMVSAVVVPWFRMLAGELAVTELGLPTNGDAVSDIDSQAWVVPTSFDFLQDLDWPLFLIGIVLGLITALLGRAIRLQRDTEGLV
ncbi:hypothetical protein [Leucobacter tenebrionis]|uniref:hypothetical protein n=1 Tax=Leucobacter tenebrionis TaxID=2873270 RepID=UPI001CA6471C|nr:hypothetical protein [Leucobacter tenebrionis]QZY51445.1 hypothetical protein KVY00_12840 [Leucobacter tenebrionis]